MKNIIRIIMICCALTAHFALSGCGSGGGGAQNSAVTPSVPVTAVNYYSLSNDDLGLLIADTMSTENNNTGGFILRAAAHDKMITGISAGDVFRIDIPKQDQIATGVSYPVGANSACDISFPNGERSYMLTSASGTIKFSSYGTHNGDVIAGDFDVLVRDLLDQSKQYHEVGHFQFVLNN
jgi:hypothetical protein